MRRTIEGFERAVERVRMTSTMDQEEVTALLMEHLRVDEPTLRRFEDEILSFIRDRPAIHTIDTAQMIGVLWGAQIVAAWDLEEDE